MKRQTRRIEIRIETHEIKVIRFRNNGNPVEREADVSDEEGFRTDQSHMIDTGMDEGLVRINRTGMAIRKTSNPEEK